VHIIVEYFSQGRNGPNQNPKCKWPYSLGVKPVQNYRTGKEERKKEKEKKKRKPEAASLPSCPSPLSDCLLQFYILYTTSFWSSQRISIPKSASLSEELNSGVHPRFWFFSLSLSINQSINQSLLSFALLLYDCFSLHQQCQAFKFHHFSFLEFPRLPFHVWVCVILSIYVSLFFRRCLIRFAYYPHCFRQILRSDLVHYA
jgi:hypothetical protein